MRIEIGAPHKRAEPPLAERSVCRECRDRVCERGEFCPAKEASDDYDELSKQTYRREFDAVKQNFRRTSKIIKAKRAKRHG